MTRKEDDMKRQIFWALVTVATSATLPLDSLAEDAYLESDGSAENGINSRYYFNPLSRIEIDYQWTETEPKQMRIFGADDTEPAVSVYINGSGYTAYGTGGKNNTSNPFKGYPNNILVDTARHTVILDRKNSKGYFITAGVTNWTGNISTVCTNVSPRPLGILGNISNDNGSRFSSAHTAKARLYRFRIFTDDVLVHDYLPCVKGGIPGLRDQVDGVFVTGEDISVLSAGGDVETIDDDPWIAMPDNDQTNGWQSINTRYRPKANSRLEIDYAIFQNYKEVQSGNGDWYVLSTRDSSSSIKYYNIFYNKNGLGWSMGGSNWIGLGSMFPKPTNDKDVRRTVVLDSLNKTACVITAGFTNYTGTCAESVDHTYSTLMMGCAYGQGSSFAPLKVYGLRIYEDNELIHDLRPCVQGGIAGLKDEFGGAFMSCGTYTYGGTIPHEAGDGYIESKTRNISIDTGYYPNSNTCIWADWALTSRDNFTSSGGQHFVYEMSNDGLVSRIYGNGTDKANTSYSWTFSKPARWTATSIVIVTNVRHQAYIDSYGDRVVFMAGSYTNYSTTMSAEHMTNHVAVGNKSTLKLFSNTSGTGNFALMRLYGFKIWDAGTLVRDYIPSIQNGAAGLYDRVNNTFLTGNRAFAYGGNIASDGSTMDAYVESTGDQAVSTGYLPNGKSRIEADFAFTYASPTQARAWGMAQTSLQSAEFYINGNSQFSFGYQNSNNNWAGKALSVTANLLRHRTVLDIAKSKYAFDGADTSLGGTARDATASVPIAIFAKGGNSDGTTFSNYSSMRLYAFRIYEYENDVKTLKHEYLPYKKGNVVGLYDTVTKTIKTDARNSATPFKINGKGVEGAERWLVSPQGGRLTKRAGSMTISANAVGAVSYRWTRNGEAIAGGEDGDLTVEWEKAKTGTVETYAVVPIYDICGESSEGEPVSATVEHLSAGTLLLFR